MTHPQHKKLPTFIGWASGMGVRTDLSELVDCKGRPEWCSLPAGEHDRQEEAQRKWESERSR